MNATVKIPKIGETAAEIYKEWQRLDKEIGAPYVLVATVVGFDGGFNVEFGFVAVSTIGRLYHTFDGKGVPSYTFATNHELEEIHKAILTDRFQLTARPTRAASYELSPYEYHRATGWRKIPEE